MLQTFTEEDWVENFRLSRTTFHMLCEKVRPFLKRQNTQFRQCICVEHRLAITLWTLATCSEYRTIGHLFGVARCTVCVIVHETCNVIVDLLLEEYIQFPRGADLARVVEGFKTNFNMIQYAGAIDNSHVTTINESHRLLQ